MRKRFIGGVLAGVLFFTSAISSPAAASTELPFMTTNTLLSQRTSTCQASLDETLYCSGNKRCNLALVESANVYNAEKQATLSSNVTIPQLALKEEIPTSTPELENTEETTNENSIITSVNIMSITASPEAALTPTPTVQPAVETAPVTPVLQSGLNADLIMQLINEHRLRIGLPAFEKDPQLCSLAISRTPELYAEIYINHNMHSGLYNRNLPYWITENMISQPTEAAAVNWWLNSSIHRAGIQGNYKYSCGACQGNECSQLFTNYQSK